MASTRPARPDDLHDVARLLEPFEPGSGPERWRPLFQAHWGNEGRNLGRVLVEGDRVVGYLGAVEAHRPLAGRERATLNLTTWYVEEPYRSEGLKLLLPLLKLGDHVVTDFTPSATVAAVLGRLGFVPLDAYCLVVPPVPRPFAGLEVELLDGSEEAASALEGDSRRVYLDHRPYRTAVHVLVRSRGGETSYALMTRRRRRRLPFHQTHYLDHPELFRTAAGAVATRLAFEGGVGVVVEPRLLGKLRPTFGYRQPLPRAAMVRPVDGFDPRDTDASYSEYFLLPSL